MMTKEEIIQAGELYERVIFDLYPDKRYMIRAVSDVIANSEELARHYPRVSVIVTLVDPDTGERKKAGPMQLELANPDLFRLKLQAKEMAEKEK